MNEPKPKPKDKVKDKEYNDFKERFYFLIKNQIGLDGILGCLVDSWQGKPPMNLLESYETYLRLRKSYFEREG